MGRLRETIARWASAPVPVVREKAAYSWAEFERIMSGTDTSNLLADYSSVGDPFQTNAVVYAAVKKKAVNISGVEWQILNDAEDPVPENPITRLFASPYPGVPWSEHVEAMVSNLELHGKTYVVFGEYLGKLPVSMWVANSEHMKEIPGKDGQIASYEYGVGAKKVPIALKDVMRFQYWKGLAPITAARLDVLQQFHANQYNVNFFRQGGLIKGFFRNTAPRQLSPEQEKELQRAIEQRGGRGNANAHKIPVFSGVEYVPVGLSQKDMEFLALQGHSMDYILMVLGVPKAILGFTDGFNYANMREIRKDFWNKSLIPIMHLIEWGFEEQFFKRFGLAYKGAFNLKGIQELQEDLGVQATTAKTFYDMGVPFQALNERLGLGFPDDLETEDRTPPQLLAPAVEDDEEPEDNREDNKKPDAKAVAKEIRHLMAVEKVQRRRARERKIPFDVEIRRAEWQATEKRMRTREESMEPKIRAFFAEARAQTMAYLKDTPQPKAVRKEAVDSVWLKKLADYLAELAWGEALFKAVETDEVETFTAGAKRTYWGIGLRFDLPPDRALAFVHARKLKLADATDEVIKSILDGLEQGMASDKISDHIQHVFDGCSKVRSKVIARTETTVAYNGGRVGGMKELGIAKKQWINSEDEKVRDSHRDVGIVGIDEPFLLSSGAKVMYPGDGPASEACNCRCTVGSVIE